MTEEYANKIEQSIQELGIDQELGEFVKKHMGKMHNAFTCILGLLLLPLSGCQSYFEYSQEYLEGKNKVYRALASGSVQVWSRLLTNIAMKIFVALVQKYHNMSQATKSRFRVTLLVDSTSLLKFGQKLGLVGTFWSGLLKRLAPGIELVVLYVVFGNGRLMLPVDMRIRRPDPQGRGRKCKQQPSLVLQMIQNFKYKCFMADIDTAGWFISMDSWYCSKVLRNEISRLGFEPIISGKSNYIFYIGSQRYTIKELQEIIEWKKNTQNDIEYAKINVTSPTFGSVKLVFFKDSDGKIKYLLTNPSNTSSVRIIVAYKTRWWIEEFFKILKNYLNIEKFQMTKENEIYAHICLRFLCFIIVCYCAKKICKQTIPHIIRNLNRYWFLWFPQLIEKYTLSPPEFLKVA